MIFNTLRQIKDLGPWGHSYKISRFLWVGNERYLNWRVEAFQKYLIERSARGISESSLLDLGCLDGLFSIEFGKLGARVTGIDVRRDNILRSQFAKDYLNLTDVEFIVKDVTKVSNFAFNDNQYDIILICGLLYHLTAVESAKLIGRIRQVSKRDSFIFLDTHISFEDRVLDNGYQLSEIERLELDGHEYLGRWYQEFNEDTPLDSRIKMPSSSMENSRSFWFTRKSLVELLDRNGFEVESMLLPPGVQQIEELGRPVFVLRPRQF